MNRPEATFPVLGPAQLERLSKRGAVRKVQPEEILFEQGDPSPRFYAVISGRIEVVRPVGAADEPIMSLGPGQFTGESNLLSGRRSLVRIRVKEAGDLIEMDRDALRTLIQTDSELSEILMRAFILRRTELLERQISDVVLIGSRHSAGTLRVKEFLTRNGHPFSYVDLDLDNEAQELLDQFKVSVEDVPVLICRGRSVLRNPTNSAVADCLGFNASIDPTHPRDVIVIGAGPAGLAAAVYAASEGLDVLVIEAVAPGGQAGSSSKIENYLGFPNGISGAELAARAATQALKFGAELMIARSALRLECASRPFAIAIDGETRLHARAIIIATGAEYRRLGLPNLPRFEGAGIFYGATGIEAQLCEGEDVIVVGGGNSAGQAAVFLSESAKHVHLLVRSEGLAKTMSRYLIRRIEASSAITLETRTEITALSGDDHLEAVTWRNNQSGEVSAREIRNVFLMMGASPNTDWLEGCIELDEKGFIRTGPDLTRSDPSRPRWPLSRPPHLLETSLPGVFAIGDVRSGNVKRVASAVGEGSISIQMIHQVLQE